MLPAPSAAELPRRVLHLSLVRAWYAHRFSGSARLDAAAQALWAKVMAGEERAQEVWLRNRTRFAALNELDMRPEQHEAPTTVYIDTRLPWQRGEMVDEDGPLEAGEAG